MFDFANKIKIKQPAVIHRMSDKYEYSDVGWKVPVPPSSIYPHHRASRSRSKSPRSDDFLLTIGKYLLKDVVFYGHYQEKRLVEPLKLYRDLIVVSNTETELKKKLEELQRIYHDKYSTEKTWLGVTNPNTIGAPAGYCIWTDLEQMPFGEYWFRIKRILYRDNEIILKIKCLGQYDTNGKQEIPKTKEPEPWDNVQYEVNKVAKNFKDLFDIWKNSIHEFFFWFCSVRITISNSVAVLKFIGLLLVTFVAITVQFIQYFGIYSLKIFEQFNNLIKVLTPFMLGVLELISKIIGGFFMLIAMIWKDSINLPARRRQTAAIGPPPVYRPQMMIKERSRSGYILE